jgi:hypothetical protein
MKESLPVLRELDQALGSYGSVLMERLIVAEIKKSFSINLDKNASLTEALNEAGK